MSKGYMTEPYEVKGHVNQEDGKIHIDQNDNDIVVRSTEEWKALQRDYTRFLIIMCAVCSFVGFVTGFVACAIAGAWL